MSNRTRIAALAALAVGGCAAAGAGAPQQDADETYRLVEIDGGPLPTVVEEEGDCTEEVLEATLTLEADGDWNLVSHERETCGADVDDEEEHTEGDYVRDGATIRFGDGDAADDDRDDVAIGATGSADIDIEDLGTGTRSGDLLTVRLDDDARTVLVFRR